MALTIPVPIAPLATVGIPAAVAQGTKYSWNQGGGENAVLTWKGRNIECASLYQLLKAVAGGNPTYDGVTLDLGRGAATVTATLVDDGEAVYELFPNEVQLAPWMAPYFLDALTDTQIVTVRREFDSGAIVSPAAWVALQKELLACLQYDITWNVSQYVLRETKTVSKRSQVKASYDNVNAVDSPPDVSSVNTLIGTLPLGGQWIKKSPTVRQYGKRKWNIVTEWWRIDKVHKMYGGSWQPTV